MTTFRKCFVLRQVEVPMVDLRVGDLFRLEGDALADPSQWSAVTSDAKSIEPDGNCIVNCVAVKVWDGPGQHHVVQLNGLERVLKPRVRIS